MARKNLGNGRGRRLLFESLEERQLLTAMPVEYATIRDTWSHFELPESPSNVNIIEIEADDLSITTLRDAINSASNSPEDDLILIRTTEVKHSLTFSESDCEFLVNADPVTSGSLTILATGVLPLTLDAMEYSRIFRITKGNVQLGNLTLSRGSTSTDIQGNTSSCAVGGGIAIASNANLILDKVTVQECDAAGIFDDNNFGRCSMGGGIYNAGSLSIFCSFITSNIAHSGEVNSSEATAYGAGGGIFNAATGKLFLHDTSVSNNIAESKTIIIPGGGGSTEQAVSVDQYGQGGGLYNSGKATIDDQSVLSDNFANHGGGIFAKANCLLSIVETKFLNNEAKEFGGALYGESNFTCVNTVFSGNKATSSGGAIFFDAGQNPLSMTNVTMTGNTAGEGAGIMLFGQGSKKSELLLINSIVVNNRDSNGNVIDISGTGIFRGLNTLSSFTGWSNNSETNYLYDNYLYDSTTALFVRDYDFTTGIEGDYRLVYDPSSQAIDSGSIAAAWDKESIDSASLDYEGLLRISGDSIDLGAYEYQYPSDGFESCFPENPNVQQGCSFNLLTKGITDSNGNAITNYLIDLDGDGEFELSGSCIWISWNELFNLKYERGCFYMKAQNSAGDLSDTRIVTVHLLEVLPSICVKETSFFDDRILNLSMSVDCYGRSIQQWTINWGDGTETEYNCLSQALVSAHYYSESTESKSYNITLRLIDTKGDGGDIIYYIGTHTVPGSQINDSSSSSSSLPDETLAIAFEEEDILSVSSALANTILQEPILTAFLFEEPQQRNNRTQGSENQQLSAKQYPFTEQTEDTPNKLEYSAIRAQAFIPLPQEITLWNRFGKTIKSTGR